MRSDPPIFRCCFPLPIALCLLYYAFLGAMSFARSLVYGVLVGALCYCNLYFAAGGLLFSRHLHRDILRAKAICFSRRSGFSPIFGRHQFGRSSFVFCSFGVGFLVMYPSPPI